MFIFLSMLSACSVSSSDKAVPAASGDDYSEDADNRWVPTDIYFKCSPFDCDFTTIEGDYKTGVATWHPADSGFALVGDWAVMTVSDEYAAHPESETECYEIYVQGAWDDSVSVEVKVDAEYGVFGLSPNEDETDTALYDLPDGSFSMTTAVESNAFEPWTMNIRTLKVRGKIVFSIEKRGEGDATFYFVEISGDEDCAGDAVTLDD
ncbi:MAG: hypothetical protein JXX14_08275 [Deltaproteobacteria bacterium]|nr:hypothetical protein [Deltaproteobacteria bacterium]